MTRKRGRRMLRFAVVSIGLSVVVAQAVPVSRTNPPVDGEIAAPAEVSSILRRACYDCHSHETTWPWYARVAPASWLVAHDVNEGRDELNFSTWTKIGAKKRAKKLDEVVEEVEEGEMPPWFYVALHPEARLADRDVETLRRFAEARGAKTSD